MIDTEALTAEERDLRSGLLGAAGAAQLGGAGARAMHPPSPHVALAAGRRARVRRRAGAASVLGAAALSVAVAGAGVGTGAFTLPWLRADGAVSPATLYASPGTRVGDLVNAMDLGFTSSTEAGEPFRGGSWFYSSGPLVPGESASGGDAGDDAAGRVRGMTPDESDEWMRTHFDRQVTLSRLDQAGDPTKASFESRLTRRRSGSPTETGHEILGRLSVGGDGRGQWFQVRPSPEDGWLVLALLPSGASAVQLRMADSDVLLPLLSDAFETDFVCLDGAVELEGVQSCRGAVPGPVVHARFALTKSEPPIDAITYVDKDGRYVTLGAEARVD
jgi:hypothetical protein